MEKHLVPRDLALEGCDGGELKQSISTKHNYYVTITITDHKRASAEISASENDQGQPVREDQGTDSTHQAWRIFLVPGAAVCAQGGSTCKGQQTSSGHSTEKDLVQTHVAFDGAGPGDGLGHLDRGVSIYRGGHDSGYGVD